MDAAVIQWVPVLADNYAYLIHEPAQNVTAVVDPSEPGPVVHALKQRGWTLTHIINTHHHYDHVGGNLDLKRSTHCKVLGSAIDRERIPGIDHLLEDGGVYALGAMSFQALAVPGHTRGHTALWFESLRALFSGDTLFGAGCGRLFEGTPEQLWHSLCRLRSLPAATQVYCGHEYTQRNIAFALTVESENSALQARARRVNALREQRKPTVPSTLEEECATNPFLRADDPLLQQAQHCMGQDPVRIFATLRARKDKF